MGRFYSNSTLTISALSSAKSTSGILRRGAKPRSVRLNVHPGGDQSRQVSLEKIDEQESLTGLDGHSPLTSRGWALQESLLSPRQLLYGSRQIYWKCPDGFESGDGLARGGRAPDQKYRAISSLLYRSLLVEPPTSPVETRELLHEYYEMVQAYSSRMLTYDSDRLPAFSGLAQRIHTALPGEYLAGLWSYDFPRGLDWTSLSKRSRSPSYHAPSWSWVAANGPVRYPQRSKFRSDKFRLQLLEYDICLCDASNPYGQIKAGHAIVQGYTSPVAVRHEDKFVEETTYPRKYPIDSFASFDRAEDGPGFVRGTIEGNNSFQYFEEYAYAYESKRYLLLVLGRCCKDSDDSMDEEGTGSFRGIILCQVADGEENEFERVGYVDLGVSLAWLEKCDKQVLKLV